MLPSLTFARLYVRCCRDLLTAKHIYNSPHHTTGTTGISSMITQHHVTLPGRTATSSPVDLLC